MASSMAHTATEQNEYRKYIPMIAVMILGAFVSILNQTIINVALPEMMDDLHLTPTRGQWLVTVFMLVNGILIPLTAFLMQKFTTRQLFITAMSLFAAGTFLCGAAPGFAVLVLGRIVQACGAGIMMPLMMNVILTVFPVEKRGRAMGVIGVAMVFGPAVGPTLSGWIVQTYSWRVVFFIVLPIALLCLVLALFFMKNVTKLTHPKIDLPGVILSTFGFGGILYGFSSAGEVGWGSPFVLVPLLLGALSLTLFIWRQLHEKTPMLEFRVFKYHMFTLTSVISGVITMAMFSGMLLLPIYVQDLRGFTPLESGLLLLPGALVMGIMSPVTGWIFDRVGAKWLAIVGLTITTVTTWEFAHLTETTTYMFLVVMHALRMLGLSMLMMPIMTAGLNQLPQRMNPHGTAMANTLRMISGSVGTALLVTVMSMRTTDHLREMMISRGISAEDSQQLALITQQATIAGINDAFLVATALSFVALLLSFFIKRVHPPQEDRKLSPENKEQDTGVHKVPATES